MSSIFGIRVLALSWLILTLGWNPFILTTGYIISHRSNEYDDFKPEKQHQKIEEQREISYESIYPKIREMIMAKESSEPPPFWIIDENVCQKSNLDIGLKPSIMQLLSSGSGGNGSLVRGIVNNARISHNFMVFGMCPWEIGEKFLGEDTIPPSLFTLKCLCDKYECAGGHGVCKPIQQEIKVLRDVNYNNVPKFAVDRISLTIGCLCVARRPQELQEKSAPYLPQ